MDDLTLAVVLTASGAVAAAAIVRQLVEVLKHAFPLIDSRISGASLSFILTAVLYVVAFLAAGNRDAESAFTAFLAWLACATSAIGINSLADHVGEVRSGSLDVADDAVPADE